MSRPFRGLPVHDAQPDSPPLIARVTISDVVGAEPRHGDRCVFARAYNRNDDILHTRIGAKMVYVKFRASPYVWIRYQMTQDSIRKVRAFDKKPQAVYDAAEWIAGTEIEMGPPVGTMRHGGRPNARGSNTREGKAANIRRDGVSYRRIDKEDDVESEANHDQQEEQQP
jgi:hypothetical protein